MPHSTAAKDSTRRIPVSSLLSPDKDTAATKHHHDQRDLRQQSQDPGGPRAPRPSYTEEQKFFIMYARIVLGKAWPDIENDFCRIFNERSERTKGGLTSVYYRIRENYHLKKVLANGQHFTEDKIVVEKMARGFQPEFLIKIGYPIH